MIWKTSVLLIEINLVNSKESKRHWSEQVAPWTFKKVINLRQHLSEYAA
jgi:hypothetical protein